MLNDLEADGMAQYMSAITKSNKMRGRAQVYAEAPPFNDYGPKRPVKYGSGAHDLMGNWVRVMA